MGLIRARSSAVIGGVPVTMGRSLGFSGSGSGLGALLGVSVMPGPYHELTRRHGERGASFVAPSSRRSSLRLSPHQRQAVARLKRWYRFPPFTNIA